MKILLGTGDSAYRSRRGWGAKGRRMQTCRVEHRNAHRRTVSGLHAPLLLHRPAEDFLQGIGDEFKQ